ncbi:MAG: DUF4350 domain-containing protein [Gammaproteobacteria bacterium]|nr:DUF4350 domain-containing protein [Gammaproteobacteria bacterium]
MSRSAGRVWAIVALLFAAGVGMYFVEWVEVADNTGYSRDARRNPFLAAEQFLARFGIETLSGDGLALLDDLPPTTDTLLIASSRRSLSQRRVADLRSWVDHGGRLILLASDLWDYDQSSSGDSLLDGLGVRLMQPDGVIGTPDVSIVEQILEGLVNQGACGTAEGLVRISLADEEQDITSALGTASYLDYQGDFRASFGENSVGAQLLYLEVGDGAVVVMTSLGLWSNRYIHCHDHAHLLRWLTDDRPVLWWLFNTEMSALPVLVWQRWPIAVSLAFVWLALWVWRGGFRLQRIPAQPDTARRELTEYLDGVARFYWQQGDSDRLLMPLRRLVLRGVPPTPGLVADLARRSGHSAERVRRALAEDIGGDSSGFVMAMRTLHDLNNLN